MRIHERVRSVRETRKLSQQTVAGRAGLARSRIQALEEGENVTIETIEKACAVLGLHLIALTTEEVAALRTLGESLDRLLPASVSDSAPDIRPEVRDQVRQLVRTVRGKARES
jgi:transcriptional regulator with XRE-family HTH domain